MLAIVDARWIQYMKTYGFYRSVHRSHLVYVCCKPVPILPLPTPTYETIPIC